MKKAEAMGSEKERIERLTKMRELFDKLAALASKQAEWSERTLARKADTLTGPEATVIELGVKLSEAATKNAAVLVELELGIVEVETLIDSALPAN